MTGGGDASATGRRRRSFLRGLGAACGTLLAGCTGDDGVGSPTGRTATSTGISGRVTVAGSSTVYPLTLHIGTEFSRTHPGTSVSVSPTGTGGGFTDFFCVGETDINNASRPITDDERTRCADNGVEFLQFQVATDALTVIVNDDADWVDCVTPSELAAIWRRDGAETWEEVRPDWPAEPIAHYGPSTDSGTFDYFADAVLEDGTRHRVDYDGTEQDSTIVEGVAGSRYAIGYLGYAYYAQNEAQVRALAVDNGSRCVRPAHETARSGEYAPLSRPLFIYVARSALARPVVRAFVDYYLDTVDTETVSEVGYVPVDEATAAENRSRFEEALATVE